MKIQAVAFASLMLPASILSAAGAGIETGKPFPGLVLPSLRDGSPMSLAPLRGKKVILHVFASW